MSFDCADTLKDVNGSSPFMCPLKYFRLRTHVVFLDTFERRLLGSTPRDYMYPTHRLGIDPDFKSRAEYSWTIGSVTHQPGRSTLHRLDTLFGPTTYFMWVVKDEHGRVLKDTISMAEILINVHIVRVSGRSDLFSDTQFRRRGLTPVDGYYAYFFCTDPRSETHSGSFNTRRVESISLRLRWKPSVWEAVVDGRGKGVYLSGTVLVVQNIQK